MATCHLTLKQVKNISRDTLSYIKMKMKVGGPSNQVCHFIILPSNPLYRHIQS